MEQNTNLLRDVFNCIPKEFRPEYSQFKPELFDEFVSEYKEFITEFGLDKIKQYCLTEATDKNNPFLLVAGDLSGIQDTVYTISSKGALKTLRARSFMLELLCEHCCYEILTNLLGKEIGYKPLRKHVVFSGGGRFLLVLPNKSNFETEITDFKKIINDWTFDEFSGRLYVALAVKHVKEIELTQSNEFQRIWQDIGKLLDEDKRLKFNWKFEKLFDESLLEEPKLRTNQQECQICHRDDIDFKNHPLRNLNNSKDKINNLDKLEQVENDPNSSLVHELCYQLFRLGDELINFKHIYRTQKNIRSDLENKNKAYLQIPSAKEDDRGKFVFYYLSSKFASDAEFIWAKNMIPDVNENKAVFLYSDHVRSVDDLPKISKELEQDLYFEEHDHKMIKPEKVTASFSGLANAACGSDLIGCLRMDVDNLGKIFTGQKLNIQTISTLSRFLNLFFKVFLSRLCRGHVQDKFELTDLTNKRYREEAHSKRRGAQGRNVSIIYAGGDDLFIVGSWDEIVELGYDIQQCFTIYSGLGISAGVTLHKPKFPIYQMARLSGEAESFAKQDESHHTEKKKNRIALFYDLNKRSRREAIINILESRDASYNIDDRYRLAIKWQEYHDFVKPLTEWFLSFFDFANGINKIPSALIEKLFLVGEEWQIKGQLYIPTMARIMEKTKTYTKENNVKTLQKLLIACTPENIKKIHIPLIWISYLRR